MILRTEQLSSGGDTSSEACLIQNALGEIVCRKRQGVGLHRAKHINNNGQKALTLTVTDYIGSVKFKMMFTLCQKEKK